MNKRHNLHSDTEPLFCAGDVEIRSNPAGDGKIIFGYYALFNERSREMRTNKGVRFVEVIKPGAFDKTDFSDVEARFDHTRLLAAPPTLKHGRDSRGAWYSIDYDPLDPDHVSVLRKIERGDTKGSSFQFSSPGPDDQNIIDEAGIKLREIRHIPQVFEFGPVILPAYAKTSAFVRSLDQEHDDDIEAQQDFARRKKEAVKFLSNALS